MDATSLPQNSKSRGPYFYHLDSSNDGGNSRVGKFLEAFAAILPHSNYRFLVDLYSRTSAKCGRCAASCQVYQASHDLRDVPCYRTSLLLDVYRRHFTRRGGWRARMFNASDLDEAQLDEMAELFYRCTACRECHRDFQQASSIFDHTQHQLALGSNASCRECHPGEHSRQGVAPCQECHDQMIPIAGQVKYNSMALPYLDAMHDRCRACHEQEALLQDRPELVWCSTCHTNQKETALQSFLINS